MVDATRGQFSLVPVATAPFSDISALTVSLEASMNEYSAWLLALQDAIKVCHVKTLLLKGPASLCRTPIAVQWYKRQFETYEEAMNTIEFGGAFLLHGMHNTSGMKSNTDMSFLSSVRIWLQAEEEDTGLVFFLAGEEEEEGSLRPPPSLSSSSSSCLQCGAAH